MINSSSVTLINTFPDFSASGFDMDAYNNFFKTSNSIINAKATDIAYPEHWGCLSIKCAFGGEEVYKVQNRLYAVNNNNFLVLNEGQYYSSYIYSKTSVESFTLNFTNYFVNEVSGSSINSHEKNIDEPSCSNSCAIEFAERFYPHGNAVSRVLFQIRDAAKNFNTNAGRIDEMYYVLMDQLLLLHDQVSKEIDTVTACKYSTRKELYKRLHYAKDFIDSCYASDISLDELSKIALLNTAYFLRQFKNYFHITPHQYVMQTRLNEAKRLLQKEYSSVTDICSHVGYEDVSSFIKLFKKQFGYSPEYYRKCIA